MRQISTLHELYMAFIEINADLSRIVFRREYKLPVDGNTEATAYLTKEEKEFLDAVQKLEIKYDGASVPSETEPEITASTAQHERQSTSLFDNVVMLKANDAIRQNRYTASGDMKPEVQMVYDVIMKITRQCMKKVRGMLSSNQYELVTVRVVDSLWKSLGKRLDLAFSNAASILNEDASQEAQDSFLHHFLFSHAMKWSRQYAMGILYTVQPTGNTADGDPSSADWSYGHTLENHDAIAINLHMLNMCRLHPKSSASAYGNDAASSLSSLNKASMDEISHAYATFLPTLNEAINAGVQTAMAFIKNSPFFDELKKYGDTEVDNKMLHISATVGTEVRISLARLHGNQLDRIGDIVKLLCTGEICRPYQRYPGCLVMQHIREITVKTVAKVAETMRAGK